MQTPIVARLEVGRNGTWHFKAQLQVIGQGSGMFLVCSEPMTNIAIFNRTAAISAIDLLLLQ